MYDRVIDLAFLDVGVTVWNVWDLPLWAWRSYAAHIDDLREQARKLK